MNGITIENLVDEINILQTEYDVCIENAEMRAAEGGEDTTKDLDHAAEIANRIAFVRELAYKYFLAVIQFSHEDEQWYVIKKMDSQNWSYSM